MTIMESLVKMKIEKRKCGTSRRVVSCKRRIERTSRLHELVRFEDTWDYPIVTARVVGRNPGRFLTTFVINRGKHHGLKEEMPVFSMRGLVGKFPRWNGNMQRFNCSWIQT